MLAALCSCQTLAVLSASQPSLAEGSRPRERVLPRPLSLPTQREACKGGKLRRARKLEGRFRPSRLATHLFCAETGLSGSGLSVLTGFSST